MKRRPIGFSLSAMLLANQGTTAGTARAPGRAARGPPSGTSGGSARRSSGRSAGNLKLEGPEVAMIALGTVRAALIRPFAGRVVAGIQGRAAVLQGDGERRPAVVRR